MLGDKSCQPIRSKGSEFYSHKEMKTAKNLSDFGGEFFPKLPDVNIA